MFQEEHPPVERCVMEGCETILSRYNKYDVCNSCKLKAIDDIAEDFVKPGRRRDNPFSWFLTQHKRHIPKRKSDWSGHAPEMYPLHTRGRIRNE
jgi:hypothetical protein